MRALTLLLLVWISPAQAEEFLGAFAAVVIPATGSSAQDHGHGPAAGEYARAIHAAVQRHWEPASYNDELVPGSSCAARIVQMPGGDVLSVDFYPDCDFDEAGRSGIVDAVRQSGPLPYHGFEGDFQREIRLVFRAAGVGARKARAADQAATEQAKKDMAESDRQWEAAVELRRRHDEHARLCSFHLQQAVPADHLRRMAFVNVTIDRSGKVVGVAAVRKKERVDRKLAAALRAAPPCEPVPADLAVGEGTVKIGLMVFGIRSE